MNAVEIEEAVSQLASEPFDRAEFPFSFLTAFGNKPTTIARLRSGASNSSDIPGGILQRNNIHIATCAEGETARAIEALKLSPKTTTGKVRFVVATDGMTFEAEDLASDDPPVICDYADFPNHFGFFLPLAGINAVKQIRESAFDVRATGRLNKLYIELRKHNPNWDKPERQHDMNHFMARLIFCFFAEDTDIFKGTKLFSSTIEQMSAPDGSNVHDVIEQIFRAMNTKREDRKAVGFRPWAEAFPYVNGGLFAGSTEVPRFTKLARAFLTNIGGLEWRKINPDIFGSMIQAVADDEERGSLGMHYTSVPNILKVLNPLFLDNLRAKVEEAGNNPRTLLNLRKRISRIRVFDPACGSGNFLVIAYKEMRWIEAELNKRRGEEGRATEIPITNFRGIELRDFPCEIARLALIIAEYQCDVLYRGQKEALNEFLPLDAENWITCGNALRLDWLSICPPTGTGVKHHAEDLFHAPLDQAQIDFENEGGETYICGNPPYLGGKGQSNAQKSDLAHVFGTTSNIGELDYVTGWFVKAARYATINLGAAAFVSTNSINQGAQVHQLWPRIFQLGIEIFFAHKNFKWSNNASNNAAVICSVIGLKRSDGTEKQLFEGEHVRNVSQIGPYLVPGNGAIVSQALEPISKLAVMITGNSPYDGGNLILSAVERETLLEAAPEAEQFIKQLFGSKNYLNGELRFCLWIEDSDRNSADAIDEISDRIKRVRKFRENGGEVARGLIKRPYSFRYTHRPANHAIIVPRISSERRQYVAAGLLARDSIISDSAQAIYDPSIWHLSILLSSLHMAWVRTVAGRLKTDPRYSSALCYNTFPVPTLTDKNKADLTRCAEDILLAREAHFPATIAELYDPENMPADLRAAHERCDEVLERAYIGRRFRNDTERLEKLFELYGKMIASAPKQKVARNKSERV